MTVVVATLFATSCHKTCTCQGYDNSTHAYTAEEVDQLASGNCSNMIFQGGIRYYSVCSWD